MEQNSQTRSVSIDMQQGVGACEGRLRSNNRAMVMSMTLHGLSDDETRKWIRAFREPQTETEPRNFELQVELLHSDYSHIGTKSGSKRFPDSLNIVKFDGSILRTETDVVVAPGNTFVVSTVPGAQLRTRSNTRSDLGLRDLIRVSGGGGGGSKCKDIGISLKLATNITSKAHNGRHFLFRVKARELDAQNKEVLSFSGVTESFELFAKPTTSESSQETLRRQASAHSLASLASLASLGLQACESEETYEAESGQETNFPAAAAAAAAENDDALFLFPASGVAKGENTEAPPKKKMKIDAPDTLTNQQAAAAAVWNVLAMAQAAQPVNSTTVHDDPDYLTTLRPDCPGNVTSN